MLSFTFCSVRDYAGNVYTLQIFRRYLCFAGIGIQNARLFARVQNEKQQNQVRPLFNVSVTWRGNDEHDSPLTDYGVRYPLLCMRHMRFPLQVLLGLAQSIFEEQTSLQKLVRLMMSHARNYLFCRRIALYLFAPSEASVSINSSSREYCINPCLKNLGTLRFGWREPVRWSAERLCSTDLLSSSTRIQHKFATDMCFCYPLSMGTKWISPQASSMSTKTSVAPLKEA